MKTSFVRGSRRGGAPGAVRRHESRAAAAASVVSEGTAGLGLLGARIVSTGTDGLDGVLGGGLIIGSVLILEEDTGTSFSKQIARVFAAQALAQGGSLFVASDMDAGNIVRNIPPQSDSSSGSEKEAGTSAPPVRDADDAMKIAWRYEDEHQSAHALAHSTQRASHVLRGSCSPPLFDLAKSINGQQIADASVRITPACTAPVQLKDACVSFLRGRSSARGRGVKRVLIQSLFSPTWIAAAASSCGPTGSDAAAIEQLFLQFLLFLRHEVSQGAGVALVTVPASFMSQKLRAKVAHIASAVVAMQSFSGAGVVNEEFKEFHGVLEVLKAQQTSALRRSLPGASKFLFRQKRRQLVVEHVSLPPDVQDDEGGTNEAATCGSGGTASKLDF